LQTFVQGNAMAIQHYTLWTEACGAQGLDFNVLLHGMTGSNDQGGLVPWGSCNISRRPHHEDLPCAQNRMPASKFMTGELGNQVSKVFESKWV
jgi:hypothetical protein